MRQFVVDASHELRTPLTSVRGLAEYGLQQGAEARPQPCPLPASCIPPAASAWALRNRSSSPRTTSACVRSSPPGDTATASTGHGRGEVTVADESPGMTPEQAARVFERSRSTPDPVRAPPSAFAVRCRSVFSNP
ncbi:MAG TPA: sensor histidine kinase [Trebonia sp.]